MLRSIYLVKSNNRTKQFLLSKVFCFNREDGFQKDENTFNDIRFEEACILYNIGAIYSKLGANETRKTHEVYHKSLH